MPLVSVLMPAYNAEKYIAEAIESILNQTFKNFEFIIIDDSSTDNSWKIIQRYAKKYKRIRAYRNKKNLYIAATRNRLIQLAKRKYIAWQDADDISMPNRLQKQYDFLEAHPKVGIIGGYLQFFNQNGDISIRTYALDDAAIRKNIFRFSPVAQPTAMIRKKCFEEFGKYDLKYPPAEDIDMSFRIGTKYQFANLPQITLKYRENDNSATFRNLRKIELSTIEVRKKYHDKYNYRMSFSDKIYNWMQFVSAFFVPVKIKIALFNFIRNKKHI